MVLGDAVSKLETFLSILSHIERSITWSLFTLKASHLVKWSISTWSFMWWCHFINWLKFETRPVPCWITEWPIRLFCFLVASSGGIFWARECIFWHKATILDLVTVEGWGEGKFAEGVGMKWKKWPNPALPQPSTGKASNYKKMVASKTWFIKCSLSK